MDTAKSSSASTPTPPPVPRAPSPTKPRAKATSAGASSAKAAPSKGAPSARKPAKAPSTSTMPAPAHVRRNWDWLYSLLLVLAIVAMMALLAYVGASYAKGAFAALNDRIVALEQRAPIPGPQGPAGSQGPAGPQGPKGDPGVTTVITQVVTIPAVPAVPALADTASAEVPVTGVQTDTAKLDTATPKGPIEVATDDGLITNLRVQNEIMTVKIPVAHGFVASMDPGVLTLKGEKTEFTSGVLFVVYNDTDSELTLEVSTGWNTANLRHNIHGTLYKGTYDDVVSVGKRWNVNELKPIFWVNPTAKK